MAAPTVRGRTTFASGLSRTSPADTAVGDLVLQVVFEKLASITPPTHTLQGGYAAFNGDGTGTYSETGYSIRISAGYVVATQAGAQSYQAYTSSDGSTVFSCLIVLTAGTWSADAALTDFQFAAKTNTTAPGAPSVTLDAGHHYLVIAVGGWSTAAATSLTPGYPTGYTQGQQTDGASSIGHVAAGEINITDGSTAEDPAIFTDNITPTGTLGVTIAVPNLVAQTKAQSADALVSKTSTLAQSADAYVQAASTTQVLIIGPIGL